MLLLAAAAMVYLPALDGELLFDDTVLSADPLVIAPFAQPAGGWLGSTRPLTTFTFALNQLAVGGDTRGWHLTNLAVHLAAVVLAWWFARRTLDRSGLTRPDAPALVAAGLFALHPMQTEAVAYLSQRAESLSSAIYLAALLVLLRRDDTTSAARRRALLAGAVALHALALAAKPVAATLPVAWLLHAAILPATAEAGDTIWRRVSRRLPAALPFFALSAAVAAWGLRGAAGSAHAGFSITRMPVSSYVLTELRVIPEYLRLLAWPIGQCADRAFRASRGLLEPGTLAGAALLAGVVAGAVLATSRLRGASGDSAAAARVASFGALFYLVALAPSSSFIPLKDAYAEHRVYLAALGPFLGVASAAAAALRRLAPSRAPLAGGAAAIVVLGALGLATSSRAEIWTTQLAFWRDATRTDQPTARAFLNLGSAQLEAHDPDEALASFRRAFELRSDDTVSGDTLLANKVAALLALGRADEARAEVDQVLAAAPRDPAALATLARVEFMRLHTKESERAALAALAIDSQNQDALHMLGRVRLQRGDAVGALAALRRAVAAMQEQVDPELCAELGELEEMTMNRAAACSAYARAAAEPGNPTLRGQVREAQARLRCP